MGTWWAAGKAHWLLSHVEIKLNAEILLKFANQYDYLWLFLEKSFNKIVSVYAIRLASKSNFVRCYYLNDKYWKHFIHLFPILAFIFN